MSFEITAVIVCDNCGERRVSDVEKRVGHAKFVAQGLREEAESDGWLTVPRGRYHTPAHYCPQCIDKPIKPIKSGKRKPRPKKPPCRVVGFEDDPTKAAEWWKDKK